MFFDKFYSWFLVLITAAMFAVKRSALSYPQGQFEIELLVLLYYIVLKYVHIQVGVRGNKIESKAELIVMMVLGVFCVFTNVYFLVWQTYIMWIELVLNLGAMGFTIAEMVMALIATIVFSTLDAHAAQQLRS